jgi:hypothetical protein
MSALHEWQRDFLRALLGEAATLPAHLHARDDSGERLAIYRHNWRGNIVQALQLVYPVVARLVGDEFFAYCTRCFAAQQPSHSANLDDYGAEFPAFLRAFPAARTLAYLGDVAALELAIDRLAASDDALQIRVDSNFPILKIWQCHQPEWRGDATVDLDEGANSLLVRRAHGDVVIEVIEPATHN